MSSCPALYMTVRELPAFELEGASLFATATLHAARRCQGVHSAERTPTGQDRCSRVGRKCSLCWSSG